MSKTNSHTGYLPGLDGIRAIAVAAVVAYHLQVPFFDGGLLGVSVFFTLSGYLITSLLLQEFERSERVDLKAFWIRRAQRLLPALFLMLPVIIVTTAIAQPEKLMSTLRQLPGALLYVANWVTISQGGDYFQRFSGPGPLDHLWSLAVEEQFYILWPLIVVFLLKLGARNKKGQWPLTFATALFIVGSTWAITHLYDPHSMNNTRAYEGTDARAAALLVGALAAMWIPFGRISTISARSRGVLEVAGTLGLLGVLGCFVFTDEYSSFLYRGGELFLSLCTAALSMCAAHPGTRLSKVLGVSPLRWVGARSYGIYLWHLPVVAFVPSASLVEHPVLGGLIRLAFILGLAALSLLLLEDPIRRRSASVPRLNVAFRAVALVPVTTMSLAVWPMSGYPSTEMEALEPEPTPDVVIPLTPKSIPVASTQPGAPAPLITSCREVIHLGDSTSLGLVSKMFLPNADDRIAAQYQAVGIERFLPEISGARSMVETYEERPNATQVARKHHQSGYSGCWVLALGTNDPANTGGDAAMLKARIDAMMTLVGDKPALWTTTKTLREKGPYQNANMQSWNQALAEACTRYPNMRVYDWAGEVKDEWFSKDSVHFNSTGYKERAARIAKALATAFPREGTSPSTCLIHTPE